MFAMSTTEGLVQVGVEIGFRGKQIGDTIYGDTSKAVDSMTNWSKPPVQYMLSNPTTFLEIQDACQQEIQRQHIDDEYSLVGGAPFICSVLFAKEFFFPAKRFKSNRTKGNAWSTVLHRSVSTRA